MFELVFMDRATGHVNWAVTDVTRVRYVTSSEVGFDTGGRSRSASFPQTEKLEINRIEKEKS